MRHIMSIFLLGSFVSACSATLQDGVPSGPVVDLGGGSGSSGSCSSGSFTASVCSCTDIRIAGYLSASSDPANPTAGGVGANGNIEILGYARSSGTLQAAGAHPLGFDGYVQTGRDLASNGAIAVAKSGFSAGYLNVGGSARVAGDIALLGYARIDGDLTQPAGSKSPLVLAVGGARQAAPVHVDPPCACGAGQVPDLAGLVADARTHNDNGSIGLDPGALTEVIGAREVVLADGRFFVESVSGTGAIKLHVAGHAILSVGGDVDTTGLLSVTIEQGGELDLFIGGNLRSFGAGALGPRERPGALRVYVAGADEIELVGATGFAGNLYAPHAAIRGVGATVVRGSLFGQSIEIPGYLEVGYDASVQGSDCEPVLL